jgi:putative membrane protein
MPSDDRRLHPLSIVFALVAQLRTFALPGLAVLVTAGSAGWGWELWAMPLLLPYALAAVLKYVTFRYRYEPNELVIRSGLFFRNERHVPYARIQNLDAVQNVFHRLWGVVEVRVETGGGEEVEAKMSVLPLADFEEMRRRVFAGRSGEAGAAGSETLPALAAPGRTLLALKPLDLVVCGLIQNRGVVVIMAGFGLLWEVGLMEGLIDRVFGEEMSGRGVFRSVMKAVFGRGGFPLGRIALMLGALAGLLLFIRFLSMVWSILRLYGFRITRDGDDLRTEYGLLTRVVATIPVRRIQTVTIKEGPLHRLFRRASVRVDTAGGGEEWGGGESKAQREWLAPVLRRDALPGFLREVLPEVDLAAAEWQPSHPRAYRREVKGWLLVALGLSLPFAALLRWWDLALLAVLVVWACVVARFHLAHYRWALAGGAVLLRSGWIWRQMSVARFAKIQAVSIHESPFDRRARMARVRVDTAGAGDLSHRVDIHYLARETARELYNLLTAQAARTAFRW